MILGNEMNIELNYKFPNGRIYRIINRPNDSFTKESAFFHIETFLTTEEVNSGIFSKHYPEGKFEFIQECETLTDAKETLCLMNRHNHKDIGWLDNFEIKTNKN